MNIHVVPFGEAGWRERLLFFEQIVSERPGPPFLHNDILLLVASSRLRRAYGEALLDIAARDGARAVAPPDIVTLHQFARRNGGGGHALIDETARLVLFEHIVKTLLARRFRDSGLPASLAPSLSAAAAEMVEELSLAGVGPEALRAAVLREGIADKPQVGLLLDAYERYRSILAARGLTDPAGMLEHAAASPRPDLLTPYRRIIIDGFHDASDLEARVLRRIAGHDSCTVVVEAVSPDSIRGAGTHHPLRLTRELLERLGSLPQQGPGNADPGTRYLAAALFTERSFDDASKDAPPDLGRELRSLSAVSMREEVCDIAASVKDAIRTGTPADAIVVAFPSLDVYGPLTEEVFRDHGIPFNRGLGRQLGTSPVATAVISLLQAVQEEHSGPSLLRVLSSPFLRFAELPGIAAAFDRLMRAERITGGSGRWLAAAALSGTGKDGADVLSAPLRELFGALAPFGRKDAVPLAAWMERLEALVAWSGLAGRTEKVPGPLNVNRQALRALRAELDSLASAGRLFPEERTTFDEWLFLLKRTLARARFQVKADTGGVQVLGLEETTGRAWSAAFFGGLTDSAFPQRLPQNIFLPEPVLELMQVRPLEKARLNAAWHFYRFLLSAPRVTLSRPENEGDKPVVPSPFLHELTPLKLAGILNRGVERAAGRRSGLQVAESRSLPALAKALSCAAPQPGIDAVLDSGAEGMAPLRDAVRAVFPAGPQRVLPAFTATFAVSSLETYLECPYHYFVRHQLRLKPLEETGADITAAEFGIAVHTVLHRFLGRWDGPLTATDRGRAQEWLAEISADAFRGLPDTFRNRREHRRFLTVIAPRFLDAEIAFSGSGFRAAHREHRVTSFPLDLPDGTSVALSGTIDRIDVDDAGRYFVVDYKTGVYDRPGTAGGESRLQLHLYALMAAALSGSGRPPRTPVGLVYYDLTGKKSREARDTVLYDREAVEGLPLSLQAKRGKSSSEFRLEIDAALDRARTVVASVLRGEFPAKPSKRGQCAWCASLPVCGGHDDE